MSQILQAENYSFMLKIIHFRSEMYIQRGVLYFSRLFFPGCCVEEGSERDEAAAWGTTQGCDDGGSDEVVAVQVETSGQTEDVF